MTLTAIGKSMYGTAYTTNHCFPFSFPDISKCEWGDTIRDNGGKGVVLYVNQCSECKLKYLSSLLCMVPDECRTCTRSALVKE